MHDSFSRVEVLSIFDKDIYPQTYPQVNVDKSVVQKFAKTQTQFKKNVISFYKI